MAARKPLVLKDGAVEQLQAGDTLDVPGGGDNLVILAADVVDDTGANTIRDLTGLSFPVVAGETYWFRFVVPYTAAATTTGTRWSINGPAFTMLSYIAEWTLTATTKTTSYGSTYDFPAAANATSLLTGNLAIIEGVIKPSANGTLIGRFAAEVTASAITAKAGATLRWKKLLP